MEPTTHPTRSSRTDHTSSRDTVRLFVLAFGAILTLSTLQACGSDPVDSDPASGTTVGVQLPTVSKAVFVEQGNQICQTSSSAIGERFRAMSTAPKPVELTAAYESMLKESYKLVGEMLAVGPPAGQERALLDLLVDQYKVTETVEEQGQAAFFADEDSDPWAGVVETLVEDFGLSDCARGE